MDYASDRYDNIALIMAWMAPRVRHGSCHGGCAIDSCDMYYTVLCHCAGVPPGSTYSAPPESQKISRGRGLFSCGAIA